MLRKFWALCLIASLLVMTGCARKTMFISEPAGAKVVVNGEQVCETPCNFSYKTGPAGENYDVVLVKDGYDPVHYRMEADQVDQKARKSLWTAGLMIPGGSLLWVGSLFTNKLKQSYRFVMREEQPVVAMHHHFDKK